MPLTLINPITYTDTTSATQSSLVVPTGTIISSVSHTRPTGFLLCDGSNDVSRSTYSNLFNAIVPNKGAVTINIATGVITLNSHGFLTGESIFLTTTGALPTGLSNNTNTLYYVINNIPPDTTNTFRLATTYANAIAGTAISTSGSQDGIHTLFYCPYGLGNNTSNFKLPDFKNATIRGRGLSTAFTNNDTTRMGNLENDALQSFGVNYIRTDATVWYNGNTGYSWYDNPQSGQNNQYTTSATVTGLPRTTTETRMKNQGVNFFIKF